MIFTNSLIIELVSCSIQIFQSKKLTKINQLLRTLSSTPSASPTQPELYNIFLSHITISACCHSHELMITMTRFAPWTTNSKSWSKLLTRAQWTSSTRVKISLIKHFRGTGSRLKFFNMAPMRYTVSKVKEFDWCNERKTEKFAESSYMHLSCSSRDREQHQLECNTKCDDNKVQGDKWYNCCGSMHT